MPTIVPLLRGRIIILVQSLSWGITCVVSYYHSGPQRQYKNICLSAIIFMTEGLEFPFQSPSRFIQARKKENMATTQLPFPFFSFEIENVARQVFPKMWFGSCSFFWHSRVSQHNFSFKATSIRGSGAMLSWREARRELWEKNCVLCQIFLYWVKYFEIWKKKIGIKRGILLYLTDSYVFADRQIASVAMARGR